MRWLHISDIHFNMKGYDSKNIQKKLLTKLQELDIQMQFILITGDCLFRFGEGTMDQTAVISFIKDIAKACKCAYKKVYICPGNHDVDRENSIRNNLISEIRENKADFSLNYPNLCRYGHDRFQIIHKGVTSYDYEPYKIFAPRNEKYRIISIDSCLLSKDKMDCQNLMVFNEKIYEIGKKIKDDDRINLLIMHHGIEFFKLTDARKFVHWVEDNNIDVICCGHTHRAAVNTYDDLERDIKQFTAGAIVADDYAIPSFFICESSDLNIEINFLLYTYTIDTENWALDNQLLRKFRNGNYVYELPRLKNKVITSNESNILKCKTTIDEFNFAYIKKYGSNKIYSNKHEGYEKFDSWKIVHSLIDVKINYVKALELTHQVIEKITSDDFITLNSLLSSEELRDIVYDTIIHYNISLKENEYDISCCASRYARKYSRNKEIRVIDRYGRYEKLNHLYIKNTLLKNVMDFVTDNKVFYEKIFRNELSRMADAVLDFLKNMEIFEIREEALLELVKEYITQKPHPWLVNGNRKHLLSYHKKQGINHIQNLQDGKKQTIITQMEAAYHICSAFLVQYDDYVGCTETSPITILAKAINNMFNKDQENTIMLPMQKFQIIQLKKDLESHEIKFADFVNNVNILNRNIVIAQKISLNETKDALLELWGMLIKLEGKINKTILIEQSIDRVRDIFISAKGFVVKANLRELSNCFWVEPNWEKYEIHQQHLGKQMLVCVLLGMDDVQKIYKYLYMQNRRENITEIVFVLENYLTFTSEDRKEIRATFKGKYLRCIFIQEENFKQISNEQGWRNVFYKVLEKSRIS